MTARKQSFLRALFAQIISSAQPGDGGYVFDLRGRWRYEARGSRVARAEDFCARVTGRELASRPEVLAAARQ